MALFSTEMMVREVLKDARVTGALGEVRDAFKEDVGCGLQDEQEDNSLVVVARSEDLRNEQVACIANGAMFAAVQGANTGFPTVHRTQIAYEPLVVAFILDSVAPGNLA